MRVLGFPALLTLLLPAIPAYTELTEADGKIGTSSRKIAWMVRDQRQ